MTGVRQPPAPACLSSIFSGRFCFGTSIQLSVQAAADCLGSPAPAIRPFTGRGTWKLWISLYMKATLRISHPM